MNEIYENSFFDSQFQDEELPDDFFNDDISSRISNDPTMIEFKKPFVFEDEETSLFGDFDRDNGLFNVGVKKGEDPLYYVTPDYTVAEKVYDWYRNFLVDPNYRFPSIDPCKPLVPHNKYEKRMKNYPLESIMCQGGMSLYNPSYSLFVDMSSYCLAYAQEIKWSGILDVSQCDVPLFEPFCDTLKEFFQGQYVSMQFNPFHPFSITKIISMKWKDNVCSGTYVDLGESHHYSFDLDDARYRVHSDQWKPLFADLYHYNCYDLVSNYDFASILPSEEFNLILEPLYIEPFSSDRRPEKPYSVIGPWKGFISRCVTDMVYTPAFTHPVPVNLKDFGTSKYFNITRFSSLDEITGKIVIDFTKFMKSGNRSLIGKKKNKYRKYDIPFVVHELPGMFFLKKPKKYPERYKLWVALDFLLGLGELKVFSDDEQMIEEDFMFCDGLFFSSYPKNSKGSIIYAFGLMDAMSIVSLRDRPYMHEFVSMSCPDYRPKISKRKIQPQAINPWNFENDL